MRGAAAILLPLLLLPLAGCSAPDGSPAGFGQPSSASSSPSSSPAQAVYTPMPWVGGPVQAGPSGLPVTPLAAIPCDRAAPGLVNVAAPVDPLLRAPDATLVAALAKAWGWNAAAVPGAAAGSWRVANATIDITRVLGVASIRVTFHDGGPVSSSNSSPDFRGTEDPRDAVFLGVYRSLFNATFRAGHGVIYEFASGVRFTQDIDGGAPYEPWMTGMSSDASYIVPYGGEPVWNVGVPYHVLPGAPAVDGQAASALAKDVLRCVTGNATLEPGLVGRGLSMADENLRWSFVVPPEPKGACAGADVAVDAVTGAILSESHPSCASA